MRKSSTPRTGIAVGGLVVALALSACGASSDPGATASGVSTQTSGKDATLAALVPAAIATRGTLLVGSDTTYAPSEFLDTDNKTPIGFDVDLVKAVATTLGLRADVQTSDFSAIIPGVVQSGKFDLGVSSFTINADREKQVDMVAYFSAGTSWAAPKGSRLAPDDACGKKVAVQTGTVQVDDVTARSTKCTAAGKAAIQIDQFQAQDAATQAVVSGKDDALLADSPVVAYAIKGTGDKLQPIGQIYGAAPYGYVVAKSDAGLTKAVQGALRRLIADGTYRQILDKWGVGAGAVTVDQVETDPAVQ